MKEEEVYKHLKSINVDKKVSGLIPNFVLQEGRSELTTILTRCINSSIENGVFPTALKRANVIPVFKKGDPSSLGNYRPISLLPALSKIFERIIHEQLTEYFNDKLSPLLCGFRKGFSTQDALLRLLKYCQDSLDSDKYVGVVLMDLSKAYDCISHELLLAKLDAYGLDTSSLDLMKSYLMDREQRVVIGSHSSQYASIEIGVPQGSILGPLLFNIFLNDLLLSYDATAICNFADDNTIYSSSVQIRDLGQKLQVGVNYMINWFKFNEMKANPNKFQLIVFHKNRAKVNLTLTVNDVILENEDHVRLLGVIFDRNLKFDKYIKEICDIAQKRLFALIRIRKLIGIEQANILANSFILSKFQYCNLLWMFCSKKEQSRIDHIHKRVLRCVYRMPNVNFDELLCKSNQFDIHTKNLQSLMLFMYKVKNGECPEIVSELFETKQLAYSLRNKFLLSLPKSKTKTYGINTVFFKGVLLWNKLDNPLKDSKNQFVFKRKIKICKIKECTCKICTV